MKRAALRLRSEPPCLSCLLSADCYCFVVKIGIVVIYVISGVAGGVIAGKMRGEQKFLWGLTAGIVYFAVLFLVSFAVQKGMPEEPVKIFTTLVLCGASGMAGGMIG